MSCSRALTAMRSPYETKAFITPVASTAALWPRGQVRSRLGEPSRFGISSLVLRRAAPISSRRFSRASQARLRCGQNTFIERRYAEGRPERLPQLAAELVRFGVDVIFAIGPPQAYAAAKATNIIPMVIVGGGDLVELRLTKSYPHPGGNVTGLTLVALELAAKRIELLKEAIPAAVLRWRARSDTVGTPRGRFSVFPGLGI